MRTIHVVLPTAVVLLLGEALMAQEAVMVGMPQYGVTLSGTPDDPVLENHSGKVIIGYGMAGGGGQILAPSALPAGLANGRSMYTEGSYPTDANPQRNRVKNVGAPALTSAALTCLIFADGHFVGADERGVFEEFGKQLKAVREVGNLAKAGAWDQIEALDRAFRQMAQPPWGADHVAYTFRQIAAQRLVETRRFKGEAAARRIGGNLQLAADAAETLIHHCVAGRQPIGLPSALFSVLYAIWLSANIPMGRLPKCSISSSRTRKTGPCRSAMPWTLSP